MSPQDLDVVQGYRGPHLALWAGSACDLNPFFPVRSAQAALLLDKDRRLKAAQALLRGVVAVYRLWQRITEARATKILDRAEEAIGSVPDIDSLRGVEGSLHRDLFSLWQKAFGLRWAFDDRNRRPPLDPLNAYLSYGNSIVYGLCVAPLQKNCLHSALSILHEPGARRHSLALDMAELYKPLLVELPLWQLAQSGRLVPEMAHSDGTACWITDEGRKIFREAMKERIDWLWGKDSGEHWGWPRCFLLSLDDTAVDLCHRYQKDDFGGTWLPSGLSGALRKKEKGGR